MTAGLIEWLDEQIVVSDDALKTAKFRGWPHVAAVIDERRRVLCEVRDRVPARPASPAPEHATPDRAALVAAFMASDVQYVEDGGQPTWWPPEHPEEAERMADVALSVLRGAQ